MMRGGIHNEEEEEFLKAYGLIGGGRSRSREAARSVEQNAYIEQEQRKQIQKHVARLSLAKLRKELEEQEA